MTYAATVGSRIKLKDYGRWNYLLPGQIFRTVLSSFGKILRRIRRNDEESVEIGAWYLPNGGAPINRLSVHFFSR